MARERRPRAPIGLGPGGAAGNMHDTFSFEGEPQKLAVLKELVAQSIG